MFAGMMIGALGWGTCTSNSRSDDQVKAHLLGCRLRPHGPEYGLQCYPFFHRSLWTASILCQLIFDSMYRALFPGELSGSESYVIKSQSIVPSHFSLLGIHAHRWHPSSRTYAKGETIPRHRFIHIFLFWRRPRCSGGPFCVTTKLMSGFNHSL